MDIVRALWAARVRSSRAKARGCVGSAKDRGRARKRNSDATASYHYKTSNFIIEDWDFDDSLWRHWATLAKTDDRVWGRVLERILAQA
jgi:hypothetical protein